MPARLQGIIPPLVTPLKARGELDRPGLKRLVERAIDGGVQGVFILGTTGEAPALNYRLRYELVESTCELVAGRVPVLVGVTDTSLTESIELAHYAKGSGATTVMAAPPYYFPCGQEQLVRYYQQLAEDSPLPVFVYNMPNCTGINIAFETFESCTRHANIIGLKDSSGDLPAYKRLLDLRAARPDWSFFVGPESLLAESVRAGGDGGVNGGSQVYPELFVSLFAAAKANDDAECARLQAIVAKLRRIYAVGGDVLPVTRGIKCALSLLGVCQQNVCEPFTPYNSQQREEVRGVLQDLGLWQSEPAPAVALTGV